MLLLFVFNKVVGIHCKMKIFNFNSLIYQKSALVFQGTFKGVFTQGYSVPAQNSV